jgi:hypothetical protein
LCNKEGFAVNRKRKKNRPFGRFKTYRKGWGKVALNRNTSAANEKLTTCLLFIWITLRPFLDYKTKTYAKGKIVIDRR